VGIVSRGRACAAALVVCAVFTATAAIGPTASAHHDETGAQITNLSSSANAKAGLARKLRTEAATLRRQARAHQARRSLKLRQARVKEARAADLAREATALRAQAKTLASQQSSGVAIIDAAFSADLKSVTYVSDKGLSHYTVALCSGELPKVDMPGGTDYKTYTLGPFDEQIAWVNFKAGSDREGVTFQSGADCDGDGGEEPDPEDPVDPDPEDPTDPDPVEPPDPCKSMTGPVELRRDSGQSLKLQSCAGSYIRIWSDPMVTVSTGTEEFTFAIGYGPGKIELSDGNTMTWDTTTDHFIDWIRITSAGRDTWVSKYGAAGAWTIQRTSLTAGSLGELATKLLECEGQTAMPLDCSGGYERRLGLSFTPATGAAGPEVGGTGWLQVAAQLPDGYTVVTTAFEEDRECPARQATALATPGVRVLSRDYTSTNWADWKINFAPRVAGPHTLCSYVSYTGLGDTFHAAAMSLDLVVPAPTFSAGSVTAPAAVRIDAGGGASITGTASSISALRVFGGRSDDQCPATEALAAERFGTGSAYSVGDGAVNLTVGLPNRALGRNITCVYPAGTTEVLAVSYEIVSGTTFAATFDRAQGAVGETAHLSASGTAAANTRMYLYAHAGGSCAPTASEESKRADAVFLADEAIAAGSYSIQRDFVPPYAGAWRACGYLGSLTSTSRSVWAFLPAGAAQLDMQPGGDFVASHRAPVTVSGSAPAGNHSVAIRWSPGHGDTCAHSRGIQRRHIVQVSVTGQFTATPGYGSIPSEGPATVCAYLFAEGAPDGEYLSAARLEVDVRAPRVALTSSVSTTQALIGKEMLLYTNGTAELTHTAEYAMSVQPAESACAATIAEAAVTSGADQVYRYNSGAMNFGGRRYTPWRAGEFRMCTYLAREKGGANIWHDSLTFTVIQPASSVALSAGTPVNGAVALTATTTQSTGYNVHLITHPGESDCAATPSRELTRDGAEYLTQRPFMPMETRPATTITWTAPSGGTWTACAYVSIISSNVPMYGQFADAFTLPALASSAVRFTI
jgi:hypothetical protein